MVYKKDKIIILQTIRHLEAHLIVKGLNPEGNVLSFFARSALKSKKRFSGGVLEAGRYIAVEYRTSTHGLNALHSAEILKDFNKIRKDYDRLQLGLHILKMVNQVGETGVQGESELFNLLGNVLTALETSQNFSKLKLFFEIRFLYIQGILPMELQDKILFLNTSIRHYHQVDLSQENIPWIQNQVRTALSQYLN